MTCLDCPKATTVYTAGGMHIDCAAIRELGLPTPRYAHQCHQVLVYMDQVFIPKECPRLEVSSDLKTEA